MQKGVFLATRRGASSWADAYEFEPYNWGPYSRSLAAEVRALEVERLIRTKRTKGNRYPSYVLTPEGEACAEELKSLLTPDENRFLVSLRHYLTNRDFNSLLDEVYSAYPHFASQSHWSGRR